MPTSSDSETNHTTVDTSGQFNPMLYTHNMVKSGALWQDIIKIIAQEDAFADMRDTDPGMWHMASQYYQWMGRAMQDPTRLMQLSYVWWTDSADLWQKTMQRFLEAQDEDTSKTPSQPDRRFASDAWNDNIYFDYLKEHYLMTSSWMQNAVTQLDEDTDTHTQNKMSFYTRQWLDAIAPSNFMITNPEVLQAALESNGESILKGLTNLREDVERGKGRLAISTTDNKAFKVGENLAATEGSVIYENHMMQLIQYAPTTANARSIPLLLIPAWINKYYIFDMQQKNSFVAWLVEQGYTVFVISWVNPDERHKDINFEDYMQDGLLKAIHTVIDICNVPKVHCMGYCLGGTLLATTLAYLHAQNKQTIVASATYLTTMVDFSEPGELGVFIDEEQINPLNTNAKDRISGRL